MLGTRASSFLTDNWEQSLSTCTWNMPVFTSQANTLLVIIDTQFCMVSFYVQQRNQHHLFYDECSVLETPLCVNVIKNLLQFFILKSSFQTVEKKRSHTMMNTRSWKMENVAGYMYCIITGDYNSHSSPCYTKKLCELTFQEGTGKLNRIFAIYPSPFPPIWVTV